MNICSPCSGDLHSVYNYWLMESLNQLSSVQCAHVLSNFTMSPELFTVIDPKDAISVVHVNKMLAAVS